MKAHSRTKKLGLLAASIGLLFASGAGAEDYGDRRKARHGPPPEALEACTDAQEGAGCSFIGRRDDSLSGTCEFMRDDFVCVPEGHRRRGGPPEEPRT